MPTAPPVIATPWEPQKLVAWLDRIETAIDRLNLFELLELPLTGSGEHVQASYHQIARTRHPDLFRGRITARDAERLMRVYGRISAAYASLRDPDERTRYIYELRQQRTGGRSSSQPAPTAVPDRDPSTPGMPAIGRGTSSTPVVGRAPTPVVGRAPTPSIHPVGSQPIRPQGSSPSLPLDHTGRAGRAGTGRVGSEHSGDRPAVRAGSEYSGDRPAVGRVPTERTGDRPAVMRSSTTPGASATPPPRGAPLSTPPPSAAAPRLPTAGNQLSPRALAFYRRAETALASGDIAAATLNLKMALSAEPGSPFLRDAMDELQRRK
jgi:hypothetical protein